MSMAMSMAMSCPKPFSPHPDRIHPRQKKDDLVRVPEAPKDARPRTAERTPPRGCQRLSPEDYTTDHRHFARALPPPFPLVTCALKRHCLFATSMFFFYRPSCFFLSVPVSVSRLTTLVILLPAGIEIHPAVQFMQAQSLGISLSSDAEHVG